MKRILLLFLLCPLLIGAKFRPWSAASSGHATAPAFVLAYNTDNGNFTPGQLTSITINSGETVVVGIICALSTTVSSVTDSGGSTYTSLGTGFTDPTSGNRRVELWGTLSATASTSITVNFSGSSNFAIMALRYTGVSAFGNYNTTNNASGTAVSVSATMQDANNRLIMVSMQTASQAATAGSGTIRLNNFQNNQATFTQTVVDNTAASAGSLSASYTAAAAVDWAAAAVELRSVP